MASKNAAATAGGTEGVRGLAPDSESLVLARDLDRLDLGHLRHGQNLVAAPIRASHSSLIESEFFLERFAEPHDHTAFHAALELPGIDNLATLDADSELGYLHRSVAGVTEISAMPAQ